MVHVVKKLVAGLGYWVEWREVGCGSWKRKGRTRSGARDGWQAGRLAGRGRGTGASGEPGRRGKRRGGGEVKATQEKRRSRDQVVAQLLGLGVEPAEGWNGALRMLSFDT